MRAGSSEPARRITVEPVRRPAVAPAEPDRKPVISPEKALVGLRQTGDPLR
jgi:hypothetical protein